MLGLQTMLHGIIELHLSQRKVYFICFACDALQQEV